MPRKPSWQEGFASIFKIVLILAGLLLLLIGLLVLLKSVATRRAATYHGAPTLLDKLINSILNSRPALYYFGPWVTRRNTSINRQVSPKKLSFVSPKKVTIAKKVSF